MTPSLQTQLQQIGQIQAQLPAVTSVLLGLVAAVAVIVRGLWLLTRHVGLIAHEGAHAVMVSGVGHKIDHVHLDYDGTGYTKPVENPGFLEMVIGYLGPSLFGLGAAALISAGHIVAVLWAAEAALIILLTRLHGWFSFGLVAAAGTLLFLVGRYAEVGAQVVTAYGLAWILLLAGVQQTREHGRKAHDAELLRNHTHLPRGLWAGLWLCGSVLALIAGAILLV